MKKGLPNRLCEANPRLQSSINRSVNFETSFIRTDTDRRKNDTYRRKMAQEMNDKHLQTLMDEYGRLQDLYSSKDGYEIEANIDKHG